MAARMAARIEAERERIIAERKANRKIKTPAADIDEAGSGYGEEGQAIAEDAPAAEDEEDEEVEKSLDELPIEIPELEPEQPPFRRH